MDMSDRWVPGSGPHPGLPLLALYVACVAAPITVVMLRRRPVK